MESMLFMIVIIALMILMMWVSGRKSKQQQTAIQDFRQSLKPGDEVATSTGLLGKIASVDQEKEQVVIDSEGSLSRWRIQAITKPPIVPAYVHDDEVDEEGNPLPEVENEQDDSLSDSSEQSSKADKVDDESKDSTDKTTSADSRE
ncbi:Transporter, putative The general secretory pathway (Sec) [Bifidobacterium coryneforme]|uniref:Transporter, putative The general secretory pathway (Sec) n=2 Tax=Bifidobacterium coryneforme TaxID=1687 RepID=A0ABD4AFB0_9BIFI|nr:Transporter, putative The general secretory pathway (Sec) [Bifidobacterium coryneforme]